jgi:SAM domain (Sterile alpha motif)
MGKKASGASVATEFVNMDDGSLFGANAEDFDSWDSQQLADFLSSAGLMAYRKMVLDHKITGKFAHLLTDEDLRDMGMIVVGDRLRFKQLMMTMGRKARFCNTTKAIWIGEEVKYYSEAEKLCCTGMGVFPDGTFD